MSPQPLSELPRPSRLLEAVRTVFEHAGFEVTTPFNRPKLVDFIVIWPARPEPLAVACLPLESSGDPALIAGIVASAQSRGYAKVQLLCDVPCSPAIHQAAAQAQAELVDGPGFEDALATLPEDVRLRFASAPDSKPSPVRKTPPPLPLSYLITQPAPVQASTSSWVVAAGISGAIAVSVLAVIGVATAIAMPNIGRSKAATAATKTNLDGPLQGPHVGVPGLSGEDNDLALAK